MKQIMNVGVGGKSFSIDKDAYDYLNNYLKQYRAHIKMGVQSKEVMEDLEQRIAELFSEKLNDYKNVVTIEMVSNVVGQLGMQDGEPFVNYQNQNVNNNYETDNCNKPKKLFRNPLDKVIGGVCSGLAIYFNIDVVIMRIIFVVCLFLGSAGFWVYIFIWIAAPLAVTSRQKCEMFGLPVTAENISKFNNDRK